MTCCRPFGLRWAFTWLVRWSRVTLGFLGKIIAVLLSPFVWITQKSYNILDRHYPALLNWALARRAAVLGTAVARLRRITRKGELRALVVAPAAESGVPSQQAAHR